MDWTFGHPYVTFVIVGIIGLLVLLRYIFGAAHLETFLGGFTETIRKPAALFIIIACAVLVFIFYLLGASDGRFLSSLEKTETARGLITFLVVLVTVVIAIILTLYPLTSSEDTFKDRFGLGKEVFTTLIGVLGTIVGFYFGSTDRTAARVEIAEVKLADSQLYAHTSGGVAPYRYTIRIDDATVKQNQVSNDGWIIEPLSAPPKTGASIVIDVTDSKDQKATRTHVVPEPAPTKPPEKKTPTTSQSP